LVNSFVPSAWQVDHNDLARIHFRHHLDGLSQGVGAFQGWDDPFRFRKELESSDCLIISYRVVLCQATVLKEGVGWPDARVVRPAEIE